MATSLANEATNKRVNSDNTTVIIVALNNGIEESLLPIEIDL